MAFYVQIFLVLIFDSSSMKILILCKTKGQARCQNLFMLQEASIVTKKVTKTLYIYFFFNSNLGRFKNKILQLTDI